MKISMILVSVMGLTLMVIVSYGLLLVVAMQLRRKGRRERPKPSDTAIVLGAYTDGLNPSPTLVARLRAALHLYRNGVVLAIIVSGGQGSDETVSESRSMKHFLMLNGVPPVYIFEDRYSTDTWENLKNSQKLMENFVLKSAVIVTSDYHLPRALAVAKQLQMDVTGFAARSSDNDFHFALREVFARVKYTILGQAKMT